MNRASRQIGVTGRWHRIGLALGVLAALSGCAATDDGPLAPPVAGLPAAQGPAGAEPGTCWGRSITPAMIETVTHQRREANADATGPALYTTDTQVRILRPRSESWFQAICPEELNSDFIMQLQRALAARGYYDGAPTGRIDAATSTAIGRFQDARMELDSARLSRAAAQRLGLVAVDRDTR